MTDKQKLKILQRTREILARPKGWSKHGFWHYRNEDAQVKYRLFGGGRGMSATNDLDDFSFCLAGAAKRAHSELYTACIDPAELVQQLSIETLAAAKLAARGIVVDPSDEMATFTFNDRFDTRKKDVLALLDEKIAELETE